MGAASFTLSAWFKTSSQVGMQMMMQKGKLGMNGAGYFLRNNNGFFDESATAAEHAFQTSNGPNPLKVYNTSDYNDNIWHHITAIRTDSTLSIYIDGALTAFLMAPPLNVSNNDDFVIGAQQNFSMTTGAYSNFFVGALDDVRVYNRALSASEIGFLSADANCNGFALYVEPSDVSCYGMTDGSVWSGAEGAHGNVSYLWNTGATDSMLTNVGTGNYTVTATDALGCVATATASIHAPMQPITVADNTGTLSWATNGHGYTVEYSSNSEGPFSVVYADSNTVAAGSTATYATQECGYYRVKEAFEGCEVGSNIVSRAYSSLLNHTTFTIGHSIIVAEGYTTFKTVVGTTPAGLPSNTLVTYKLYENNVLSRTITLTLDRAKNVGYIDALYASCTAYKLEVSFSFNCTEYRRIHNFNSPVVNSSLSRLGRKSRVSSDTLDLKWNIATNNLTGAGASVTRYEIWGARITTTGSVSGTEVLVSSITNTTQIGKREARITTAMMRTAGLLSSAEKLTDVSLRFRVKTVLSKSTCNVLFSDAHFEYRCADFTFITGCNAAGTMRTAKVIEGETNEELLVYPNPSNGQFSLLVPESMLQGDAQVEIIGLAGQKVLLSTIQGAQERPSFDLSQQPAGIYVVRITNGDKVYTSKIVIE
jgi:hypothetical protein